MDFANNKKVFFDYAVEDRYEAGMALTGWEVKAIRDKRMQLRDSYVLIREGELFLLNTHISPLATTCAYLKPDASRTRKLLLNRAEINRLIGKVEQKGYTLVPLRIYAKNGKFKCEIGLAKGKKEFDKRNTEKDRDWQREKERLFKKAV